MRLHCPVEPFDRTLGLTHPTIGARAEWLIYPAHAKSEESDGHADNFADSLVYENISTNRVPCY